MYTAQTYYTFGSSMPGLAFKNDSSDGYRFAMNTQEEESELGEGFTSATLWIYGYSWGGVLASQLAKELKDAGIIVDVLFTVDMADALNSDGIERHR